MNNLFEKSLDKLYIDHDHHRFCSLIFGLVFGITSGPTSVVAVLSLELAHQWQQLLGFTAFMSIIITLVSLSGIVRMYFGQVETTEKLKSVVRKDKDYNDELSMNSLTPVSEH